MLLSFITMSSGKRFSYEVDITKMSGIETSNCFRQNAIFFGSFIALCKLLCYNR